MLPERDDIFLVCGTSPNFPAGAKQYVDPSWVGYDVTLERWYTGQLGDASKPLQTPDVRFFNTGGFALVDPNDEFYMGERVVCHFKRVNTWIPTPDIPGGSLTGTVYMIDVIRQVVEAVDAVLYPTLGRHVKYFPGTRKLISEAIQRATTSPDAETKAKYPMVALVYPFDMNHGDASGYYAQAMIPKIVIADLSNITDPTDKRYDNRYRPTLYPIYEEFLRQLTRHANIVGNDPNGFQHTQRDLPGDGDMKSGVQDVLDSIVLLNLRLTIKSLCNN